MDLHFGGIFVRMAMYCKGIIYGEITDCYKMDLRKAGDR